MNSLQALCWCDFFQQQLAHYPARELLPARIIAQHKGSYIAAYGGGELTAQLSGAALHRMQDESDFPAVGDWVILRVSTGDQLAMIEHVLERKTRLVRVAAGGVQRAQLLAANVDIAFIAAPADALNIHKLDRYLSVASAGGAEPVIVLTKCDLAQTAALPVRLEMFPCIACSAREGSGIEALRALCAQKTSVFLGSSGVGKSSLVNALLGSDAIATQAVRDCDGKGRHTTTERRLYVLPGSGVVIDTPGMRELGLWDAEEGISDTFEAIAELAHACRFSNCRHENEPGCSVLAALSSGTITEDDLMHYHKLQRENDFERRKHSRQVRRTKKARKYKRSREKARYGA